MDSKYTKYPTTKGSAAFEVIVSEPNLSTIKVAPYLCRFELCLYEIYDSCTLFTEIRLVSGVLNQVALHSDYVNQSENVAADNDKSNYNNIKSLACSDNMCLSGW